MKHRYRILLPGASGAIGVPASAAVTSGTADSGSPRALHGLVEDGAKRKNGHNRLQRRGRR